MRRGRAQAILRLLSTSDSSATQGIVVRDLEKSFGATKVVELKVESVSLDDPATAYVDVCWDVSGVDIVDADGKSVVTGERKNVGWTRFVVTNPEWQTAPTDGWRVSSGSDLEKEPCAAS